MSLAKKVKKTVLYGQIFNYHRSLEELHYWLISAKKHSFVSVKKAVISLGINTKKDVKSQKRNATSLSKVALARQKLSFLRFIPTLYFVGLTGSVSASNAKKGDDIDVLIVTSQNSLWLVRPVVLLCLQYLGIRRKRTTQINDQKNLICTNLWLTNTSLGIPKYKQSLYTAHEILQILPLIDKSNLSRVLLKKNQWVKKYLYRAYTKKLHKLPKSVSSVKSNLILAPFNLFAFLVQYLFMLPLSKGESISLSFAYFHNKSYAKSVLHRYKKAVKKL